jgi:hypothetical protein
MEYLSIMAPYKDEVLTWFIEMSTPLSCSLHGDYALKRAVKNGLSLP